MSENQSKSCLTSLAGRFETSSPGRSACYPDQKRLRSFYENYAERLVGPAEFASPAHDGVLHAGTDQTTFRNTGDETGCCAASTASLAVLMSGLTGLIGVLAAFELTGHHRYAERDDLTTANKDLRHSVWRRDDSVDTCLPNVHPRHRLPHPRHHHHQHRRPHHRPLRRRCRHRRRPRR